MISGLVGSSKEGQVNEDRIVILPFEEEQLVCVFDGHGSRGACSDYLSKNVGRVLEELKGICHIRLEELFQRLDCEYYRDVVSQPLKRGESCCRFYKENPCACDVNVAMPANEGSAGTVVVIAPGSLLCANVGDCDAYVFSDVSGHGEKRTRVTLSSQKLTVTDTPKVAEEDEDYIRIKKVAHDNLNESSLTADGIFFPLLRRMRKNSGNPLLSESMLNEEMREQNRRSAYVAIPGAHMLNMTRAFGNFGCKSFSPSGELDEKRSAVICRPHVMGVPRTGMERWLVVASDGLWDNITVEEVAEELERRGHSAEEMASNLLKRAMQGNKKDDISLIVVNLQ